MKSGTGWFWSVEDLLRNIRLTTAEAIIRYPGQQFIGIDGVKHRACGGGSGMFGHGNVPCPGKAHEDRESNRNQQCRGV